MRLFNSIRISLGERFWHLNQPSRYRVYIKTWSTSKQNFQLFSTNFCSAFYSTVYFWTAFTIYHLSFWFLIFICNLYDHFQLNTTIHKGLHLLTIICVGFRTYLLVVSIGLFLSHFVRFCTVEYVFFFFFWCKHMVYISDIKLIRTENTLWS